MLLRIRSQTRYEYEKPASFSPHIVRLFPRQDSFQTLRSIRFDTVKTAVVQHRRDLFDNQIARCFLPDKSASLHFDLDMEIQLTERTAFDFLLDQHALHFPFAYQPRERAILAPYLEQPPGEQADAGDLWKFTPGQDTVPALIALNEAIFKSITYERREEGEARLPSETLRLRTGSCRDFSRLAASLLRSAGIAVRLVSGYTCEFGTDPAERKAEGALHAWIEAYVPGAGWLGMDPTNGVFCDHHFIAAAVGLQPDEISPVAGRYYGNEIIPAVMTATVSIEPIDS